MRTFNIYTTPNLILTLAFSIAVLLLFKIFHPITYPIIPTILKWESSGLFLLLGLVGGGVFFLLHSYRTIRRHRQESKNDNQKRRLAELEVLSIRAQLNPHFIFNTLGAIQYYIRNASIDAAEKQLTKFSKLLRLVLESFSNPFNTLEKEISLIQLYIELEQMRFENRFEIIYEIDENLIPQEIHLPSLILQPFVENAINKGLFHKKEKGFLKIGIFEAENNDLHFILEHNGIRGKEATQVSQIFHGDFASTSSNIALEKLKYLNDLEDLGIEVKEEYLRRSGEESITRTSIRIPEIE